MAADWVIRPRNGLINPWFEFPKRVLSLLQTEIIAERKKADAADHVNIDESICGHNFEGPNQTLTARAAALNEPVVRACGKLPLPLCVSFSRHPE